MTKKLTNKDLMVGDWVYLLAPYIPEEDKEPFKVHNFMNILGRGFIIEPIPLTEEILEENGFEPLMNSDPSDGEFYFADCTDNGCEIWFFFGKDNQEENRLIIESDSSNIDKKGKVVYVHELQHALRLCGIEKEIVI